ncbi:hypothetical protein [Halorubellus litoreus]|uniref:Uncharacterized protein n=1 Tax=Halorubellus litoreus TaxID=755308 RepID=A0ABD5VDW9_9EURY
MKFEIVKLGEENRIPIANEKPLIPGAKIRCARNLETTAYKNIWTVEAASVSSLANLAASEVYWLYPPEHNGTDHKFVFAPGDPRQ